MIAILEIMNDLEKEIIIDDKPVRGGVLTSHMFAVWEARDRINDYFMETNEK